MQSDELTSYEAIKNRLRAYAKANKMDFNQACHFFYLERAVARLCIDSMLRDRLVFKGGLVSVICYESNRFTIDVDAIIRHADLTDSLTLARRAMESQIGDHVSFIFEREIELATQNEYGGIRLEYRSCLGPVPKNQSKLAKIKIDIGVGDPVVPGPVLSKLQSNFLSDTISWCVYPIETILSEKIHSLISNADRNSRSKDIYDLSIHISKSDPEVLKTALVATFSYRQTDLPSPLSSALSGIDTSVLRRGWLAAVSSTGVSPDFDRCFQIITEWIAVHLD